MFIISVHSDFLLPYVSIYHYLYFVSTENTFYADLLSLQRTRLLSVATDDAFRWTMVSPAMNNTLPSPVVSQLSRLFSPGKAVGM